MDFKDFLKDQPIVEGLGQTVFLYYNDNKGGENLDGGKIFDSLMIFHDEATCVKEMIKDLDKYGDGDFVKEDFEDVKTIAAFEEMIEGNDYTPKYQVKKYKLR